MPTKLPFIAWGIGCAVLAAGCDRSASPPPPTAPRPVLAWVEEGISHEGTKVSLGYRGELKAGDRSVEPIVAITRDGEPVAGAMVFASLVAAGGDANNHERTAHEAAMIYEPAGEQTPTLYASEKLPLPEGQSPRAVRFRIVLPDAADDYVREIPLP